MLDYLVPHIQPGRLEQLAGRGAGAGSEQVAAVVAAQDLRADRGQLRQTDHGPHLPCLAELLLHSASQSVSACVCRVCGAAWVERSYLWRQGLREDADQVEEQR